MMRERTKKRMQSKKKKRKGVRNRIAMISITFVVCVLLGALLYEGAALKKKVAGNEAKKVAISEEIQKEEERTQEIEETKEYMQSDEYAEKVARDKLGLVKNNEIVFKEEK